MATAPKSPLLGRILLFTTSILLAACTAPVREDESNAERADRYATALGARLGAARPARKLPRRTLPADTSDLATLVELALVHSPALAASRESAAARAAAAEGAGDLPEPRVSWAEFLDPVETRVGPQERRFEVTQALPWAGAREAEREAARAQTRAATARSSDLERAIVAEVESAAWRRHRALGLAELERRGVELLRSIEGDVDGRYRTGKAEFADLLRAGDEVVLAEERAAAAEDRARKETARLLAAIGMDAPRDGQALELALRFADGGLGEDLRQQSSSFGTPALAAMDAEVDGARAAGQRAGYARKSDLAVGLFFIDTEPLDTATPPPNNGRDAKGVMFSFTIPIRGDSYQAMEEAARRDLRAAHARRAAAEEGLARDLELAFEDLSTAERRIALFQDRLLPRAAESFDATRAGYSSGRQSFTDLIETARMQIRLEAQLFEARCDRELARIELERHLGPTTTR
ncbi:MAG: TolC family protein [Planctomycetota bacterium]|nr:TolC family protein [Planctomycetota bacterium]